MYTRHLALPVLLAALAAGVACGGKQPPVARPTPPPPASGTSSSGTSSSTVTPEPAATPPVPADAPMSASNPGMSSDPLATETPEAINANSPLNPVFFAYDSDQLDDAGRKALDEDAELLKKYASWMITIEGHCDERGTAEYNLALGERRALVAKSYLLSLGLSADRFRTVSYGKEFPFDPGHDEAAWAKNRRAHLMVTAK